jgi:adenylyltransferase/sulfurtransferase
MLTDDELLRYSRQIMLPQFDIAAQEKLKAARVLVVGMGGIGCPVAMYLAAAGVGELLLADFDTVDASNLQRQILFAPSDIGRKKVTVAAEKLIQQNPHINVHGLDLTLDADNLPGLLAGVDLVIDGCDNFLTRDVVNVACVAAAVPLVSAAAIGLSAQLAVFDSRQPESPCYRCLYPQADAAAAACAESGVLASVVGVVGTLAATESLKMLTGVGQPLVGRLWLWEAETGIMRTLAVSRDPACPVCGKMGSK